MAERTRTIGAVDRVFEIVETLEQFEAVGVSELADELSASKSTVYTHLNTLHANGYIVKEADGRYRLSCQFLRLGGTVQQRVPLYHQAREEVETLAANTEERTNLVIEEDGKSTCIYAANANSVTDLSMSLGERHYIHASATGKAIFAHLPSERVDEIIDQHGLPRLTDQTTTTREALEAELARIRETGIAIDDEETFDGLCCIAAPIIVDDEVLGSISVSGPSRRFKDPDRQSELRETVSEAANAIQINCLFS
jgi:DNA-binding IclR family transcriptional regulator